MGHVSAGELSDRVTLLTPSPATPDGRGGNLPGGPDAEFSVWAHMRALSGRETFALGQTNNPAAYEVTMRYRADVSVGQRLRWLGDTYNVQRVVPDRRHEFLTLTCFNSGK